MSFIAGTRINRYEQSVHQPNIAIAHQLADILNVPVGYFYTNDDFIAQALLLLHAIKPEQQTLVLDLLRSFSKDGD